MYYTEPALPGPAARRPFMGWRQALLCLCSCLVHEQGHGVDFRPSGHGVGLRPPLALARRPRVGRPQRKWLRHNDFSMHSAALAGAEAKGQAQAAADLQRRASFTLGVSPASFQRLTQSEASRQRWLVHLTQMRHAINDPSTVAVGCQKVTAQVRPLDPELFGTPEVIALQNGVIMDKGHAVAIKAMLKAPLDMVLQASCMDMIATLGQLNCGAVTQLVNDGAVEAMTNAIVNFPKSTDMLQRVSHLNVLTNFMCPESAANLRKLAETPIVDHVLNTFDKFYADEPVMLSALSLVTSICPLPDVKSRMARRGYIEKIGELMRDFAGQAELSKFRGELIWTALRCFTHEAPHRNRLADAGVIKDIVATMRAASGGDKTDVIDNKNMFTNAMNVLKLFSTGNSTHRDIVRQTGVVDDILALMRGESLAALDPACPTLRAILGDDIPSFEVKLAMDLQCEPHNL